MTSAPGTTGDITASDRGQADVDPEAGPPTQPPRGRARGFRTVLAVIVVGALAVAAVELRLDQIWGG